MARPPSGAACRLQTHRNNAGDSLMIANMPTSTFLLYIGAFLVQFVFVIGYGIWWCLQGRTRPDNRKKRN